MRSVCVFGDSIAEGFNDSEHGGWVSLLARHLKSPNDNIHIYNCSILGESTRELLLRFETEVSARGPETIIVALGTNDSWLYANGDHNVSLVEFERNLSLILKQAGDAEIIFVGATMVDEARTTPVAWQEDISYTNGYIQQYNKLLKQFCAQNELTFIDTFSLLTKDNLDDGLHLNAQGHQKLFDLINDYL